MHFSKKNKADMDAGRKARNDYMRAWRAANKDKVKEYNQGYWQRKAAEMRTKADRSGNGSAEA